MLAALACVDYVVIFDDASVTGLVARLRPNVLAKASQYDVDGVVGHEIVEGYGGRIVLVPMKQGYSTSALAAAERTRGGTRSRVAGSPLTGATGLNPRTIKLVDAWLGVPLCWLLTIVRRVADLFGAGVPASAGPNQLGAELQGDGLPAKADPLRGCPAPAPPRKIVFLKLIELGAHVQAFAAVRRAAEMVGRENVYFWVFQDSVPILRLLDEVPQENIIVVRSKGMFSHIVLDLLATVWRVRRLKIDTVIDMEFFSRASACLAFLSGAKRRVGMHRFTSIGPYRGDLMTHRVQYNPYIHVSTYFYLLVEVLQSPPGECPLPKRPLPAQPLASFRFVPADDELRRVQQKLDERAGVSVRRPIVLLNPNVSDIVPLRPGRWNDLPTRRGKSWHGIRR